MMIRVAIVSAVFAVPMTLHYVVRGADAVDRSVTSYVSSVASDALNRIAGSLGYERAAQDEDLGPMTLCTMEAVKRDINPTYACSLLQEESAKDQFALSSAGAVGLMQVMGANVPLCTAECGVKTKNDLLNAAKNVCCGVLIFDRFLKENADDPVKALQAYNGGKGCVGKCAESIRHAQKVLKRSVRAVH